MMDLKSRNGRLKVNSIASLVYQIVVLICGFILPRLIIVHYGSAVNGLISSITQYLGIIALCEFGMGAVVPASLYGPLAGKDNEGISKVVVSAERFYRKLALVMLAYVILLCVAFPFIISGFDFVYTASLILIIASATFAQYFFGMTYSLLIIADQKQYITYFVNGATIVCNLLVSCILIKLDCSIHAVKFFSAVIFICRPLFYTYYVRRHYLINRHVVYDTEPIKQKWNGVAQHIAYTVQEKTGVIVLSIMSTLESVSVYSVYFLILEGLRGFIYSVTSGLTSFLGDVFARGEKSSFLPGFMKIEFLFHSVSVLAYTSAAVLIIPFVSVYTQGVEDAEYIVPVFAYVMCAAIGCRCLQVPYNIVVQAAGHFRETQNSAIIEPVIDIVVSLALVVRFGLLGVAIGMLVSIFYRMMYLSLYLTKHIIHTSKLLLFKRLAVDLIQASLIVLVCSFIPVCKISYLSWGIMAIEVFLVAFAVSVVVNLVFYRRLTLNLINRI